MKNSKPSCWPNTNLTEKNAVRKNLKYWKKNKRKTHYHRLLHTPSRWRWWWRALVPLIDWGRAASTADWITEKNAVRKKLELWEKIKNKWKTYHHCLLHATRRQGWWWQAVVPLIDWGRAACTANGTAIKFKREAVQKSVECGGISMRGKLTVTAFSTWQVSGGRQRELLFALPTEGGPLAWPTS